MKNFSENVDAEYPQKIFEIGRVFILNEKNGEIAEREKLAIASTPGNYTEIKQILENLFNMLDLKITFEEPGQIPGYFVDGRAAKIKLESKDLGYIGEIHPKILKNWKLKMPVALLEIDLKPIFEKLI